MGQSLSTSFGALMIYSAPHKSHDFPEAEDSPLPVLLSGTNACPDVDSLSAGRDAARPRPLDPQMERNVDSSGNDSWRTASPPVTLAIPAKTRRMTVELQMVKGEPDIEMPEEEDLEDPTLEITKRTTDLAACQTREECEPRYSVLANSLMKASRYSGESMTSMIAMPRAPLRKRYSADAKDPGSYSIEGIVTNGFSKRVTLVHKRLFAAVCQELKLPDEQRDDEVPAIPNVPLVSEHNCASSIRNKSTRLSSHPPT